MIDPGERPTGIIPCARAGRKCRHFPADNASCGNVRAGCPRSRAPPSAGLRLSRRRRAGRRRAGETPAHPGSTPRANPADADAKPAGGPSSRLPRRRRRLPGCAGVSPARCNRCRRRRAGRKRRHFPANNASCGNVRAGCPRSRAPPSAGLRLSRRHCAGRRRAGRMPAVPSPAFGGVMPFRRRIRRRRSGWGGGRSRGRRRLRASGRRGGFPPGAIRTDPPAPFPRRPQGCPRA